MKKKVLKRKLKFIGSPIKNNLINTNYKRNSIYANYYENKKVIDKTILYESRDGKSLTDNPYAIFKSLLTNIDFKDYKHIWSIQDFSDVASIIDAYKDFDNVVFVKRNSKKYLEYLSTTKYLINNSTFPDFFIAKKNQIYINTWHGTPLKKMGFEIPGNPATSKNVVKNFLSASYLISPNQHTTNMYTDSYKLDGLYSGEIIEDGYPRIDLTLNTSKDAMVNNLINIGLKVDHKKQNILYAPTWKGTNVNQAQNDMDQIIKDMKIIRKKNGDNYNVFIKVHPFLYPVAKEILEIKDILIPDYIDTNELLSATDLLITDYSSIFFDFLVTNRPILFYMWDAEYYIDSRGSDIEFDELPGPALYNLKELNDAIQNIEEVERVYKENYSSMKERFTKYDDGNVTSRLINYLFYGNNTSTKVIKHLDKKKEKLIFYPGGMMNNGITSSFINLMNNIDYNEYDVSIFLKVPNTKEALKNIAKVNPNARFLFKYGISVYSLNEIYRDRLCHNRGVGKNYLKNLYPEDAYKREGRRFFGKSKFDFSIDFSGYSLFWAKFLLATDTNKKICYMHNDILSDSERMINGKRPHFINLRGLMSVYNRFDKLVSVSEGTMKLNKRNLGKYADSDKFDFIINSINPEKVLQHRKESLLETEKLEKENGLITLNKRYISRARIVYTKGLTVLNKPIHDDLLKVVSTAEDFKGQEVTISWVTEIDSIKYYKFSINDLIIGWLDEKAFALLPDSIIETKKVDILAVLKRTKNNPLWNKPYNIYNSSKISYSGQFKNIMVDIKEVSKTQHSTYCLVYINDHKMGWIDISSLDIKKDYTSTNKSIEEVKKEKDKLKFKNYKLHDKVIDYLPNRTLRDRNIKKEAIICKGNSYKIFNKIPSNPTSKESEISSDLLNSKVQVKRMIINKNGVFYMIQFDGEKVGWINRKALKVTNNNEIAEKDVYYSGLISTDDYPIIKNLSDENPAITSENNENNHSWLTIVKESIVDDKVYCCLKKEDKLVGWIDKEGIIQVKAKGIKVNGNIIDEPSNDNINFVNMGRLSPEKAQDNLIKAFYKFQKEHSKSMLYILGQGPLKSALQKLINDLELQDHVVLTGQQEEPFKILDMCDCFILSSHYEGQPMVLLEALTLGLDIIATNIIANKTVLENGKYGNLVDDSIEGLYKGMIEFRNNGKNQETSEFNYEEYTNKAINSFYEVLNSFSR